MLNTSGLLFTAIDSELFREYTFPTCKVRIENPLFLHVSENGHRVFCAEGYSYYIPKGWVLLRWKAKEERPNFVK